MKRPLFVVAVLTMIGTAAAHAQPAPSPTPSEGLELLKQVAKSVAGAFDKIADVSNWVKVVTQTEKILRDADFLLMRCRRVCSSRFSKRHPSKATRRFKTFGQVCWRPHHNRPIRFHRRLSRRSNS